MVSHFENLAEKLCRHAEQELERYSTGGRFRGSLGNAHFLLDNLPSDEN